jgi:hypothetical protein
MSAVWPRKILDDLVAEIYIATTDCTRWNSIIETIGRRLGASMAAVHVHSQADDAAQVATTVGGWSSGRRPPGLRSYEEYFAARNVWVQHGANLMKPGAVLTGEDMCSDEILLRSEFYLDFLRPLDVRYSIRAVLSGPPDSLSYFSAGRSQRSGPFGASHRVILKAVTPHLMQAIRIQSRIESVQAGRHVVAGALERLPLAIIFLDRRCRVVEMNSTARNLIEAGDGLRLERGVLVAFDTRAEVQLQQMIFGAAEVASGRFLLHGGALSLPRPDGAHAAIGDGRSDRGDWNLSRLTHGVGRRAHRRTGSPPADGALGRVREDASVEPRRGRARRTSRQWHVVAPGVFGPGDQRKHRAQPLEANLRQDRCSSAGRSREEGADLRWSKNVIGSPIWGIDPTTISCTSLTS